MTRHSNNMAAIRGAISGKPPDKKHDPRISNIAIVLQIDAWHPELTYDNDEPDAETFERWVDECTRAACRSLGLVLYGTAIRECTDDEGREYTVAVKPVPGDTGDVTIKG